MIYNPVNLKDVENRWSKDAVNDMGSSLIMSGVGNNMFEPDREITRGEFVAVIVKALGLMRAGTGKDCFSDISKMTCIMMKHQSLMRMAQ